MQYFSWQGDIYGAAVHKIMMLVKKRQLFKQQVGDKDFVVISFKYRHSVITVLRTQVRIEQPCCLI